MQKSVMHVQSCCFTNIILLLFCRSPSLLPKLPFVVIQKFRYHGNVTSHFSLLSSLFGLKGLKTRSMQTCDGKEKRTRIPRIMNS